MPSVLVEDGGACDTLGMDLEYRAAEQFASHMETVGAAAPLLAERLAAAAERLVQTFVQDGKVLCSGTGAGAGLARHFAELMLHSCKHDRLALPAMTLSPIGPSDADRTSPALGRQLMALGRPGDVLLLVSPGDGRELDAALTAAHERDVNVIALVGDHQDALAGRLLAEDILLAVPSANHARILEVQLASLHILCDLIDAQLLGNP